jgi:DNA polymerase III epsilon subunit family exonuclease
MKTNNLWQCVSKLIETHRELVVFDVETTGLCHNDDRVIEFAAVKYIVDNFVLLESDTLLLYINPERPLPEKITKITGLTDNDLADKPKNHEVFQQIYDFMGNAVVAGYNSDTFDVLFLESMYLRHGTIFVPVGTIDVINMARDRISKKEVARHKLESIAEYFHISFTAHAALEDVRATAKILQIFINEYRKEEEEMMAQRGSVKPYIKRISFWKGFQWNRNRIYVSTSAGDIFYCQYKREWSAKAGVEIEMLDLDWLEKEAWRLTNSTNADEFLKFTGCVKIA